MVVEGSSELKERIVFVLVMGSNALVVSVVKWVSGASMHGPGRFVPSSWKRDFTLAERFKPVHTLHVALHSQRFLLLLFWRYFTLAT